MNSSNLYSRAGVLHLAPVSVLPVQRHFSGLLQWLLILLALFVVSAAARAEIAANVQFVSGVVTASGPDAGSRDLAKNDNIHSRDTIETAQNGRIQMRFTDGGLVSLMPGTTFSVDEYLFEDQPQDEGSLVFGMLRGGLRTVTGSIGKVKHDQYELKTPVATLGIRGTEYTAVLNPPNTLRVHVGRGKVVITNESGELEVPEGRNAVVTMGSAPRFSEQAPRYLVTAPTGESLQAMGEITQDPYGLDPMAGGVLLAKGLPDFDSPPPPPPGGWVMAGFAGPSWTAMQPATTFGSGPISDVTFDNAGGLQQLDGSPDFDLNSVNVVDPGGVGNLHWGFFGGNSSGTLAGTPFALAGPPPPEFQPYAIGPAPGQLSGALSYTLAGASPVKHFGSNVGTVDQLNLDIDLASLNYQLDMVVSANLYSMAHVFQLAQPGSGNTISGGPEGFVLDGVTVSCTGCQSTYSQSADVAGFLSGANGELAGIVYQFLDPGSDAYLSGAAGLNRVP